uniref:Uncharacterized protein n=1 Tax=Setaria italica TaxID=4555 RepID=K4ANZ9_SETIT
MHPHSDISVRKEARYHESVRQENTERSMPIPACTISFKLSMHVQEVPQPHVTYQGNYQL